MKNMKKLLLSALLLLCGLAPAHADGHEEPITFDRLPQAAQTSRMTSGSPESTEAIPPEVERQARSMSSARCASSFSPSAKRKAPPA